MNKRPRVVLSTSFPRVVLKQFVDDDAELLFALIRQNLVYLSQWIGDIYEKYPDLASVRRSITDPLDSSKLRLGIWKGTCLVGTVNVTPMPNAETNCDDLALVGYWIGEKFEGCGFATVATVAVTRYAFEHRGILTMLAEVDVDNFASQHVLERAGYHVKRVEGDTLYFSLEKSAAAL